jgi:hypothetical protein
MSGKIGKNLLSNAVSPLKGLITEDLANSLVFDSVLFSISKRLTIGALGVVDIVFDPTACGCDFVVILPVSFKAFGAGPINIDLYINPIYTLGTVIEAGNRDFTSPNTPDAIWTLNPTVSDPGIKSPFEFIVLSDGVAATAVAGGETRESQVSNIDPSKKYMFRLTNQENSAVIGAGMAASWFELTT